MCHSSFCLRDFVFGSSTAEKGVCAWCLPLLLNYQLWLWLVSLTYISQTLHGTAIYAYIGVVVWGVNVAAYMAVPWSVWVYTENTYVRFLYLIGLIGLQAPAPVLGQDLQRLQFRPGVRPGVRSNTATTGDRFGSDLLGGFRPPKARRKEVHRRKATSGYRVFWLLEYLSATGQLTISGTGHRTLLIWHS